MLWTASHVPLSAERVLGAYLLAVAAAVLTWFAGAAMLSFRQPVVAEPAPGFDHATGYVFVVLMAMVFVVAFALLPFMVGLAGVVVFRVDHPGVFAVYGAAVGLLLGWLFRDLNVRFALPILAGFVGGAVYRWGAGSHVKAAGNANADSAPGT